MVNDTWETLTPIPGSAREDISVVAHDGKIYIFGGATTTFNEGDSVVAAVYDPVAGTRDDAGVADLTAGRTGAAAMSWNGEIWSIGGFDGAGNSLDTVRKYDPVGDGYSDGPALPAVRDNAKAVIQSDGSNDRLYVLGGRDFQGTGLTNTDVWALNSTEDGWDTMDPMPNARRSFVATAVDGKIQLFGGESHVSDAVAMVDEYDPTTDSWVTLDADWPNPRHGPAGAAGLVDANWVVFLVGGDTMSGASNVTDANDSFTRSFLP